MPLESLADLRIGLNHDAVFWTMTLSGKLVQGFVLLIALGVTSVLVFGVWRGKTQQEQQPVPVAETTDAEMKLTDMEFTEMQQGKRFWTLRASEAKYFQGQQRTALTSVRLTFFLEGGDEVRLESKEGVLYAGSKNIELWDSVKAVLPRGYELTTEKAAYDHEQRTISSDTAIRLTGADLDVRGTRWKYLIPDRQAVIEGGVKASLVFLPLKTKSR